MRNIAETLTLVVLKSSQSKEGFTMVRFEDISSSQLEDEFRSYGRDCFSAGGYQFLHNLFLETSPDSEVDVIAICCEFNEMSQEDIIEDYGYLLDIPRGAASLVDDDTFDDLFDELQRRTMVEQLPNGDYIVQAF